MSSGATAERRAIAQMSVVDCTESVAGRFAASVLAGGTAKVVRPSMPAAAAAGVEDRFLARGITFVEPPFDQDGWEELLKDANMLLVSASRGPWGDTAGVAERFPQLNVVSVTPYGLGAEEMSDRATMLTLAAESGLLGITGEPDGAPEALRGHATDFACGWAVSSACWAAYRETLLTGKGRLVDLALLEMFVFLQWNSTQRAAFEGVVMRRQGARGLGHPWGIYPCKDGHVILIVGAGGRNWARFAELMEVPQLADAKYQSPAARAQNADEIDALMLPWLMDHTAEEIFTRAQEASLPFGMVRKTADLIKDAQLREREFFVADRDGLKWPQLPFRKNGVRPSWIPQTSPGAAQ